MNVFIADKLPMTTLSSLEKLGLHVTNQPGIKSAELDAGLLDADILIVRSTVVSEACMKASPNLMLIIRAGAGVNNINLKAASGLGIYVANCPGKNAIAVAELTIGLMLSLDRSIAEGVHDFHNGSWNKAAYSASDGIFGKTLGVIGTGQIGTEVIRRARGFGLKIVAWSRSLQPERAEELGVMMASSVEEVASCCDILTVHLASSPQTKGIISRDILSRLKDGAMVLNTSRADVIDEEALVSELKRGRLRAGLDVFSDEPEGKTGAFESPLQGIPGVYVTHHIGASTDQAQLAVADAAVDIVRTYLREGRVKNWVNRSVKSDAPWKMIVRHYDKPGVLAGVLSALKSQDINAQELENVIFEGHVTACCTIQLSAKPDDDLMKQIRSQEGEVISAMLLPNRS